MAASQLAPDGLRVQGAAASVHTVARQVLTDNEPRERTRASEQPRGSSASVGRRRDGRAARPHAHTARAADAAACTANDATAIATADATAADDDLGASARLARRDAAEQHGGAIDGLCGCSMTMMAPTVPGELRNESQAAAAGGADVRRRRLQRQSKPLDAKAKRAGVA